jgi:glycosyltransferase involved in cell wall biosynthesis
MRIVLSNASVSWGGVHRVTEILARGLQARGHDVIVLGRPGSMLEERMRGIAPFHGILRGVDFDPASIARAMRTMKANRAQLVVGLMKKDVRLTLVAARMLGIPTVMRHSYELGIPKGLRGRIMYGGSIVHVCNAEATRRAILNSADWLDASKVHVIYNGIDARPYIDAEPLKLDIPPDALRFGFLANLTRRKGIEELARAWKQVSAAVPGANLIIVGKGKQEEEFRMMLDGSERVHWLGFRRDIPSILKSLDVVVLPSHLEGVPNIILEAMASGVAVIATRVSGTPELVRDGLEARLVPARDADRLGAVMKELANDPSLRKKLAAQGHARALEDFTIDGMIDRYEELFVRLTAR